MWSAVQRVDDRMAQREERATQAALAKARDEPASTSREKPERTARTMQSDQPSGATTTGGQLVGTVTHYFGQPHVAIVEITEGELRVGDTIRVVGRTSGFAQKIESMQLDHAPVDSANIGDSVGIEMAERTREHDHVYLVRGD
jgi:translation initiation factor IF-2